MRIYIGFDDTDNTESDYGTGKVARWFSEDLPSDCSVWVPFVLNDWPPEVLVLLDKGLHTYDLEARKAVAMQLMTAAAEQLNVIPVYQRPIAVLNQPWVHSRHPEEGGYGGGRHIWRVWIDKH